MKKQNKAEIPEPEHPWNKVLNEFISAMPESERQTAEEFCKPFKDSIKPEELHKLN